MHLRDPGRCDGRHRLLEGALVLGREADDHVGRQVEVLERLDPGAVLPDRVAAAHRPEHAVVTRLQRDVEMARHDRRLAHRPDQVGRDVVDLDRREPKPLEPVDRARRPDQPGQRQPRAPVAEAAEVDAREHDLTMSLPDTPADLGEHRLGRAAARGAADERDHAERAGERAAVLDPDEGADTLEAVVGLDAADRADLGRDGVGDLLASPRDRRGRCPAARRTPGPTGSRRTRSRRRGRGCARPGPPPGATSRRPRSSRSRC